ncbi:MBL fold metallo-hydrolase [Cellulomonas bogoriensis]|uniref:Metallo-beta-lactamase domain-containing protein n=1 Tax=Cellulomonas bogoriensis 69B4 = DSM 16987 TaxID=1386082 RepID=A0A0A0BY81_9CELL|nr:MBL fold metallo-hydrolase [Cellulomonas bogoriensis]KGM12925.1 hypothetical protein N869_00795 [Cellulomonas bogoriensis 69B4 = DSM 16987]
MLIWTVVAPLLGASCHVLADETLGCLVVDPGAGAAPQVEELVRRHGLTPRGVAVTHGHVDHTWDAAALGDLYGIPVFVHREDEPRFHEPFTTLGPLGEQLRQMADHAGLGTYRAPGDVRTFDGDAELPLLDGAVQARHLPGHTGGSTVYVVADAPATGSALPPASGADAGRVDDLTHVWLTGDVLFAGTIGRTDLPGGDPTAMAASLGRFADWEGPALVLPGHGPRSRSDVEFATNPYLARRT